ncbi:MAG: HEAT repeat domain-containing protein [Erysipelotrichaceae bacterium]|nr:HEAT repeat domain-containing protein [Erysipelotrichaceae bacterium]
MQSKAQLLLIIYSIVALSMILFDIFTVLYTSYSNRRFDVLFRRYSILIKEETEKEEVSKKHIKYLSKNLNSIVSMRAYKEAVVSLNERHPIEIKKYLNDSLEVIFILFNKTKDDVVKTSYLISFVKQFELLNLKNKALKRLIFRMLEHPSIYCRYQALEAISNTGKIDFLIHALKYISSKQNLSFQQRALTELLTVYKNKDELCSALIENFDSFNDEIQLSCSNYIRFNNGSYTKEFLEIYKSKKYDDEIRLSAIRYLSKYKDESHRDLFIKLARGEDEYRWEFQSIAIEALSAYKDEEVIEVLKKDLSSRYWYVRTNAAKVLSDFELNEEVYTEIINGDDKYARDALLYQLERKKENL